MALQLLASTFSACWVRSRRPDVSGQSSVGVSNLWPPGKGELVPDTICVPLTVSDREQAAARPSPFMYLFL